VSIRVAAGRSIDAASLRCFRLAYGALGFCACVRFFTHGWIHKYWEEPRIFFPYWGLPFVHPWPAPLMRVHYALMGLCALGIAFARTRRGIRLSFALFGWLFAWAHFADKTNWLNHYWLLTLLAGIGVVLPWDRRTMPAWSLGWVRLQLGVVYVFGAIGKIGSDWLVYGEPLRIWLPANAELWGLGRFFHLTWVAIAFSWAGFLFDLTIVPLLLVRRTRGVAYAVLFVFHTLTAQLFRIGLFPWIMVALTPVFFEPSWPRRVFGERWFGELDATDASARPAQPMPRTGLIALALYALVQVLLPLRSHLYPGNTLWTEEGFRFAWKVMLIDKVGELDLELVDARGKTTWVSPHDWLTPVQYRMVVTQPDMILQLAHAVAHDFDARGVGPVRVYAHSQVSWNDRRAAPMIDPRVDLAHEPDTLAPKRWILPAPTSVPGRYAAHK